MPGQGRQVEALLPVGDAAEQGLLLVHAGVLRVPREEVGAVHLPGERGSPSPVVTCAASKGRKHP